MNDTADISVLVVFELQQCICFVSVLFVIVFDLIMMLLLYSCPKPKGIGS